MAVEIKELVVKANVNNSTQKQNNEDEQNYKYLLELLPRIKQEIIEECLFLLENRLEDIKNR